MTALCFTPKFTVIQHCEVRFLEEIHNFQIPANKKNFFSQVSHNKKDNSTTGNLTDCNKVLKITRFSKLSLTLLA